MNNQYKTGVLLINLGTPDSPKVSDVRSYLFQFLNDPRVIDLPWLARKLLVNLIIVPFRAKASAKEYQKVFDKKGSPLLYHSQSITEKVQNILGEDYGVHLAMRYKNPSIASTLKEMQALHYDKIIILPLFPQYASSSNGSAIEEVMRIVSKWWVIPNMEFISQFYTDNNYIDLVSQRARAFDLEEYDHILFSFHGLPVRHIDKVFKERPATDEERNGSLNSKNTYSYETACKETTKRIAETLGLEETSYSMCYQSRIGKEWLLPYTDKIIEELAKEGKKKLLVFSPAFVADCLETLVEIGEGYEELFQSFGGKSLNLVPSLNDGDDWANCISQYIRK
mgnify:CR=1 FL=1